MKDWTTVIGALLPLLGVLVGAALQYWFSRTAESRKQIETLQRQSYADYLRAVAKVAHAQSAEARRTAVADAADAKARIAVYGSAAVVEALAKLEEAGPILDNPPSVDCFLKLALAMRSEGDRPSIDALRMVLVGGDRRLRDRTLPIDRSSHDG